MDREALYVGVDLGGTKILAVLATESGEIIHRHRVSTPLNGDAAVVIETIAGGVEGVLAKAELATTDLAAVGVVVPGVTDPKAGVAVKTPNMNLSGMPLGEALGKRLGRKVVLANDCNAGIMGEAWRGSARGASSAAGIFVGTGIGGGFLHDRRVWRGYRNSAMEVGHMVMEVDGPECGCGNRGCLEALASRTAIERDLRQAVREGQTTLLTDLLDGDLSRIRSGALKEALARGDQLVTQTLTRVGRVLGFGCLNVRHLLDPELIVLGGGVMEACGDFLLPIIQSVLDADRLPGSRPAPAARLAMLGDDAIALGVIALAQHSLGRKTLTRSSGLPNYPQVRVVDRHVVVERKVYHRGACVQVTGKVRRPKKPKGDEPNRVTPRQLKRVCAGGPEIVFIGTGIDEPGEVGDDARRFLQQRGIQYEILDTPGAVSAFNACHRRKAALLRAADPEAPST